MLALLKAMSVGVVVVAMLIASFYLGYIIVLLAILALVIGVAWTFFNWDELFCQPYYDD